MERGLFNRINSMDSKYQFSDLRLKKNITTFIPKPIDIAWVTFEWRNDPFEKRQLGCIANAVKVTNPEYVITDPETGLMAVDKIALLIAKIAHLEERVRSLEKSNQ